MQNVPIQLATKGPKTFVTLLPIKTKSVYFSVESIEAIQSYMGVSDHSMKKMEHWLRVHLGRSSIPPYIRSFHSSSNRTLDEIYQLTWNELNVGGGKVGKRLVFCGDAEEVVEKVCTMRGDNGRTWVKVLADSGQGSFKFSLVILPGDYEPEDEPEETFKEARSSFKEGETVKKGLIFTSDKRVLMLANDMSLTYQIPGPTARSFGS